MVDLFKQTQEHFLRGYSSWLRKRELEFKEVVSKLQAKLLGKDENKLKIGELRTKLVESEGFQK